MSHYWYKAWIISILLGSMIIGIISFEGAVVGSTTSTNYSETEGNNIAIGKTATWGDSVDYGGSSPNMVDGDTNTYKAIEQLDGSWVEIDLGLIQKVTRIYFVNGLQGTSDYTTDATIEVSANCSSWTTVCSGASGKNINCDFSTRDVMCAKVTNNIQRPYQWKIDEFEIYKAIEQTTPPATVPSLSVPEDTDTNGTYQVSWSSVANATSYTLEEGNGLTSNLSNIFHLYHFDDGSGINVYDSVGSADGSLLGGSGYTNDSKIGSHSIEIDGIDGYIDFPHLNWPANGTIEFWWKPKKTIDSITPIGSYPLIIHHDWCDDCGLNEKAFMTYFGDYSVESSNGRLFWVIREGNNWYHRYTSQNTWHDDTWYHITLLWGTGGHTIYINGVEDALGPTTTQQIDESGGWHLGGWSIAGSQYAPNSIFDEVVIFDNRRTTSEIEQDFQLGEYDTVYNGTSTSTSITGKTNGTYYYRVKACNSAGCSPWSDVQDITVEVVPVSTLYEKWDDGDYSSNPSWIVPMGAWDASNGYLTNTERASRIFIR